MGIEELKGKIITKIDVDGVESILFTCNDGTEYSMYHNQDCCESVTIDDINGDLANIIGEEVLSAEEKTNESDTDWGSNTWTFYTIITFLGFLDIKWYGESNGYYSESVSFEQFK